MFNKKRLLTMVCAALFTSNLMAQDIPDEHNGVVYRGSFDYVARGVLDGNMIETNFRNHGELARWGDLPWGEWPRGIGGRHIDGVGVVVAGLVPAFDTTRINSAAEYINLFETPPDTILNPVSINYRDAGARRSPYTGDLWGWLPLPGFNNPLRRNQQGGAEATPALSDDPTSWPEFWPDRLNEQDPGWAGTWNGRDGRRPNADQESYYVMDDFNDQEYSYNLETSGAHSPLGVFFPSPNDTTMGGLGLQTKVRIYQWANILAEDTMFLIYRITNKGETQHKDLYFVQIVDFGLGADEDDDNGFYDPVLDVIYGWDSDGLGDPIGGGQQYELGYTGFAFLESPANVEDGLDNDQDGIIDESRFDENFVVYEGQEEIENAILSNPAYNISVFEAYYGPLDERPAYKAGIWFTTDENLDWVGYTDENNNGQWDDGELLNDDVGRDGLGVFDVGYPGPDEGEGDGIPTQGEPNYNELDVDESDQIGLTGADLNTRPYYENSNTLPIDTWLWEHIEAAQFDEIGEELEQSVNNDEPFFLFSSGPIILDSENNSGPDAKSTDFFSTAWIFGDDEQDFFKNRRTVQNIYNADYNFAQPPIPPTLTAVAGDGQVVLSWDDISVRSYDRFTQEFDFEGYRLYKGTNNLFTDARTITDVNGTPTFYEPIAQWDLDNDISGPKTVLEGEAIFHMGDNTGLAFHYVDNDVINGKGYYYAITAYDRGVTPAEDEVGSGIDPQENTFRVAVDRSGVVTATSQNTAFIVPTPPPAGYVSGGATVDLSKVTGGTGTGSASVNVVAESELNDDHLYRINFFDSLDTGAGYRVTTDFELIELTQPDTLIKRRPYTNSTSVINGFTLDLVNPIPNAPDGQLEPGVIIQNRTGYISNAGTENELYDTDPSQLDGVDSNWEVNISQLPEGTSLSLNTTDHDFEITFLDPNAPEDSLYQTKRLFGPDGFSVENIAIKAHNLTADTLADFLIIDRDDSGTLTLGDLLVLTETSGRDFRHRFILQFESVNGNGDTPPAPGTKFYISTTRAFGNDDYFQFGVRKGFVDQDLASSQMDNIYVVPNPYVGAAEWERRAAASSRGRGERKINFFNLPRECTIRIFNIRGELLKTIEHRGDFNEGSASWDLKTDNNEDIAYGVYFYHVSAPGIGEHVDKFAVVK